MAICPLAITMFFKFLPLVALALLGCQVSSRVSTRDRNILWFPNPRIPGGYIPGFLKTPSSFPETPRDASTIKFYLHTKKCGGHEISGNVDSIDGSCFDPIGKVVIMSHGFGGHYNAGFPGNMRNRLLQRDESINCISIDWSVLAESPYYDRAARATITAGNAAAELLTFLVQGGYTTVDKIHFIGFSLGAHVCGNGGHKFEELNGVKMPRCTALDPALPMFSDIEELGDDEVRVDPSDADLVDVIHTSGGYLFEGGLAFMDPRGHVDFYPNSGRDQPGCNPIDDIFGSCSHGRAPAYLEESMTTDSGFWACECDDWQHYLGECDCSHEALMGYFFTPRPEDEGTIFKKFYLSTNDAPPYALGPHNAKKTLANSI